MSATVVDTGKLVHVTVTALVAGVGVSTLFALAVLGLARAGERARGAMMQPILYGTLALVALSGCSAAIVYGVITLSQQ